MDTTNINLRCIVTAESVCYGDRQPTVSTVLVVAWHWRSSSLLRRSSVD